MQPARTPIKIRSFLFDVILNIKVSRFFKVYPPIKSFSSFVDAEFSEENSFCTSSFFFTSQACQLPKLVRQKADLNEIWTHRFFKRWNERSVEPDCQAKLVFEVAEPSCLSWATKNCWVILKDKQQKSRYVLCKIVWPLWNGFSITELYFQALTQLFLYISRRLLKNLVSIL